MSLITLKEILKDAVNRKYAVGAFNAINMEMVRGIIEAAEEENSPVILNLAEPHLKYMPLEMMAPVMVSAAKGSKVPVAVHLDHGISFSTIARAMNLGFSSVMYDGSMLPMDENIHNTREIVKIARELGISVEAEIGHVAQTEAGSDENGDESDEDRISLLTKAGDAVKFAESTGVDALAVAFGTAHGIYTEEPRLDFDILRNIKAGTGIPLVMHGGSGISEEDFKESINCGIAKINYYTNLVYKASLEIREKLSRSGRNIYYYDIIGWAVQAVKEDVMNTMRTFGSSGKV